MYTVNRLFQIYRRSLYGVVPFTASVGFSSGLVENFNSETKANALSVFTNIIGYTTLGAVTGLTYPITFPAIMKTVIMN
jgi:hypothetical protein